MNTSPVSAISKIFTYTDGVFVKDIKQKALNISIDSDVILKTESESIPILSEYMRVDRGILDMISFCRSQVPINTHLCVPHNKDMVKAIDNVMSTGFTVNSCISEKDSSTKSSSIVKILNIVKVLSSFPTHRHVFVLSNVEELVFLEFIQDLIQYEHNKIHSFFTKSKLYKKWSSAVDFSGLKQLDISIDAIFLKGEALNRVETLRSYILSNESKVCIFEDYLDIAISFVASKILSKDKFIYFLKYAHDHFGESVEDILSKISPLIDIKLLTEEDLTLFKKHKLPSGGNKKNWLTNYLIKENEDFTPGFLKCLYSLIEKNRSQDK